MFLRKARSVTLCAPIMTTILEPLDVELMKKGAQLFQGLHNFKSYCYKATDNGLYQRELKTCELIENTLYTANFFPKKSYLLRVMEKDLDAIKYV